MIHLASTLLKRYGITIIFSLSLMLINLTGCKKDEGDGTLTGNIIYSEGYVNESMSDITAAYCYAFIDEDMDVTNGYVSRQIIDITDITPGTTSVSYEFDTSGLAAGEYYLLGGYDFEVDSFANTDPDNPRVWEAQGGYMNIEADPPAIVKISDLSGDYDIRLIGLSK